MPTIETIEIRRLRLPLRRSWKTAYGSDDSVHPVVVRMHADGLDGWGEAQAFAEPSYCPEHAAGIYATVSQVFAPVLLGQTIDSGEQLQKLLAPYKGNPFAKAALDLAWWDLHAKQQQQPLWQHLGGKPIRIVGGQSFGVQESIEALLAKVKAAIQRGAPRVKLKFTRDWGIRPLTAVCQAFPDLLLHIDCNASFSLADIELFRELDTLGLAMIEQPLAHDDLIDHAALQQQLDTPICLDESCSSVDAARKALAIRACRIINIKPMRVGGLTPACEIQRLCQAAGVGWWVGGMLESGIGTAHALALASLPGAIYPHDMSPDLLPLVPLVHSSTQFAPYQHCLPEAPGIGPDVDLDQLEKSTIDRCLLTRQ